MVNPVYVNYLANIEKSKGVNMFITRFIPKKFDYTKHGLWTPSLGPSKELLSGFKEHTIDNRKYFAIYLDEIKQSKRAMNTIGDILKVLRKRPITLHCYEKSYDFCHRYILAWLLTTINVKVYDIDGDGNIVELSQEWFENYFDKFDIIIKGGE